METAVIDADLPAMDASSAVSPAVRRNGDILHLAYRLPGYEYSAVVSFLGVTGWKYGYPNDEGLSEHRLWNRGLTFYNFHVIRGHDLVPPMCRWIATFHDGTFEIDAREIVVLANRMRAQSPTQALDSLLEPGENVILDDVDGEPIKPLKRMVGRRRPPTA